MRRSGRVLLLALASRAAVLSLMVLSDLAFEDLDTSARLQNRPCDALCDSGLAGRDAAACDGGAVRSTPLDELAPWDSVFFVRIAKCGYETDMINAFFPFLPMTMRGLAGTLGLGWWGLPPESQYVLVGLLASAAAFGVAALALYMLTISVLGDELVALTSVVLFCLNPASVFYSAAYTESIFAAATWTGALLLRGRRPALGVLALTVASATRSNGVLGAWFAIHPAILAAFSIKRAGSRRATRALGLAMVATAAAFLPYVVMQWKGYRTYCLGNPAGGGGDGGGLAGDPTDPAARDISPNGLPNWCHSAIPSLYGYVQHAYWDIGFLRFYRKLNRLPKVAEAGPILALSISGFWAWASHDWRRALSLGVAGAGARRKKATKSGFFSPNGFERRAWGGLAEGIGGGGLGERDVASPFSAPPFSSPGGAAPGAPASAPAGPPSTQRSTDPLQSPVGTEAEAAAGAPAAAEAAGGAGSGVPTARLAPRPRLAVLRAPRGPVGAGVLSGPTSPLSPDGALSPPGALSPRLSQALRRPPPPGRAFVTSAAAAPFVHHWALMTATTLLVMHVNVSTRFLSVCPPLYWHASTLVLTRPRLATAIVFWSMLFIGLGCLLFPNFYPWT